jgi:hypothetical protein
MSNCAQYFLFAVIIFTLGWIVQKNIYSKAALMDAEEKVELPEKTFGSEVEKSDLNE